MARRNRSEDTDPLSGPWVNPAGPIYEVRSGGYTIEWTGDLKEAMAAYVSSHRRDREVLRLVNGVKTRIEVSATPPARGQTASL